MFISKMFIIIMLVLKLRIQNIKDVISKIKYLSKAEYTTALFLLDRQHYTTDWYSSYTDEM